MKVPDIGQCVLVRNRPAIIRNKKESVGNRDGVKTHLLDVEYIDGYGYPSDDRIVWERETGAQFFPVYDFPELSSVRPDPPARFHAFTDALMWSSQGFYRSDGKDIEFVPAKIISPWFSAVQVEDYQLYPVLQALSMPRVNLLLADDVGLGKTIEAGLIVQELIRQRRIRRILIVCPSSLQIQWQDEMKEKFNIDFTVLDSDQIYEMQRTLGMDANPWKVYPRIITSMDYLKQSDILRKFISTAESLSSTDAAMLPWDLLIVDEVHNFSPGQLSDAKSDRHLMLRDISPFFEHRLFLSATPHNGYTRSFSGLLEMLDPVRFEQKSVLDEQDFKHLNLVMIRRMKVDLNKGKVPPRFPNRTVTGIPIALTQEETRLFEAMRSYRLEGTDKIQRKYGNRERVLAQFIFSLLAKRLLSSSYSFARTWWNHVAGFDLEEFGLLEAEESKKRAELDVDNDDEKDRRETDALRLGASWLKEYRAELSPYLDGVSKELKRLGWTREIVSKDISKFDTFPVDTRFDNLFEWVQINLMKKGKFHADERLIIFTEYKDTLDYLVARFKKLGIEEPVLQILFGGAGPEHRRKVKDEFNDPASQLRILVATDAASEGLNLQTSCRYVIHQEIPWNPMRLEQRNGRVDRHGQSRDVVVHHFVSDQVEDLKFLDLVVRKVDTVRGDLGSVGKVLDEAVMEYFAKGKIDEKEIERRIGITEEVADDRRDLKGGLHGSETEYHSAVDTFKTTQGSLGLTEDRLIRVFDEAIKIEQGELIRETDGTVRIKKNPLTWKRLIETSLLLSNDGHLGAQPKLVFTPERVLEIVNGRVMFMPRKDTRLMMLGHPLMQKAVSTFSRKIWQPPSASLAKWTIEQTALPEDIPLIFALIFQVSLRNKLGERFNIGILEIPVTINKTPQIIPPDQWQSIQSQPMGLFPFDTAWEITRGKILAGWQQVKSFANNERQQVILLVVDASEQKLAKELKDQISIHKALFEERKKSLEMQKDSKTIEKIRKELLSAAERAAQLTFSEDLNLQYRQKYQELKERLSDADWERQHSHVEMLKQRLAYEEQRIIERVLPQRYSLDDDGVEVLPIAIQVLVNSRGEQS
ncbi:DISARM system SNF2-like helicase DrmD [Methanoregula sp.]|uniref:DISARM system SNF2-like helicase DrmD n=1 Tax=Methanoregula sp. TaxID=2052170 RepID=UPI003C313D70